MQNTDLSLQPYFDDFTEDKKFYKVLFKPNYPVQARELTTLQSMLQYQIEKFGQHIFKEGSVVIPGNITYDNSYYSVKVQDQNLGVDVSVYASFLVGNKVTGKESKVKATVTNYLLVSESEGIDNLTFHQNVQTYEPLQKGCQFLLKKQEPDHLDKFHRRLAPIFLLLHLSLQVRYLHRHSLGNLKNH